MISEEQRDRAAQDLLAAEASRVAMGRLSDSYPDLQIEDSYAIQQRVIAHKISAGAQLVGHKIGLTSRAMQEASGIDEPDFGHILDSHVLDANEPIDLARFQVPRVEVELAFILGADLDCPNPTVADVLRATAYVQPAVEIIDSRTVIPRKVTDTIADNSALGAIRQDPGGQRALQFIELRNAVNADLLGRLDEKIPTLLALLNNIVIFQ